jgi:hypothetical protein
MKLLGIISVGFDVTDQLLIRYFAVQYSIFIEFGVHMKLLRLIKMCLNEMYSKVYRKNLSDNFPIQNGLKH